MAAQSSFCRMTLCLTIICLVCGGVLGCVYTVTSDPIREAEKNKVNEGIKAVLPEYDNDPYADSYQIGDAVVYPARRQGIPVGCAIKVSVQGFGGQMVMMVGFTPDGKVYNTSVISHGETPGLGTKISENDAPPRLGVVGVDPSVSNVSVKKDGGDVDAITASTITSRAFLKGVNDAYDIFLKVNL